MRIPAHRLARILGAIVLFDFLERWTRPTRRTGTDLPPRNVLLRADRRGAAVRAEFKQAAQQRDEPRSKWLSALFTITTGSAIAILGALLYSLMRLSYVEFYAPLGLTPEEVGIGPSTILTNGAFNVLYFPTLVVALVAVIVCVLVGIEAVRVPKHERTRVRRWLRRAFGGLLVFYAGFVIYALFTFPPIAKRDGECVAAGYGSVGQSGLIKTAPYALAFEFRALPATLSWAEPDAHAGEPLPANVLYLGESGGFVVLWDVDNQRVQRLAAAQVSFTTTLLRERVGSRERIERCETDSDDE